MEELKNHVEMVHLLPIRLVENQTKELEAAAQKTQAEANKIREETQRMIAVGQTSQDVTPDGSSTPSTDSQTSQSVGKPFLDKRDALHRPQIKENSTTGEWNFF